MTEHTALASSLLSLAGARIRRLRVARGLTLRQLAGDLGISPAALSTLERGLSGVSFHRLQLIADYFQLRIVDLLAETPKAGSDRNLDVVSQCLATVPAIERGPGVTYQIVPNDRASSLETILVSFAPGSGYTRDTISHPGDEVVYVLLGQVDLLWGSDSVSLSEGDLAMFLPDRQHAIRNASTSNPAVILSVSTPPF